MKPENCAPTAPHHTPAEMAVNAAKKVDTLKNPYSVRATNPMGAVEMATPAMGMKLQRNTNMESRPRPGSCRAHMPRAVRAVLAAAILACQREAHLSTIGLVCADKRPSARVCLPVPTRIPSSGVGSRCGLLLHVQQLYPTDLQGIAVLEIPEESVLGHSWQDVGRHGMSAFTPGLGKKQIKLCRIM